MHHRPYPCTRLQTCRSNLFAYLDASLERLLCSLKQGHSFQAVALLRHRLERHAEVVQRGGERDVLFALIRSPVHLSVFNFPVFLFARLFILDTFLLEVFFQ